MSNFENQDLTQTTPINTSGTEDMLIAQIDAFRDKALQIQDLIAAKQTQVADLEAKLAEMEIKNSDLASAIETNEKNANSYIHSEEFQSTVKGTIEDSMQDTISAVNSGLEGIQNDLSEKVHTENVRVYRNLQDLIREMDNSEEAREAQEDVNRQFKKMKTKTSWIVFLLIVNLIASGFIILQSTGLIGLLGLLFK